MYYRSQEVCVSINAGINLVHIYTTLYPILNLLLLQCSEFCQLDNRMKYRNFDFKQDTCNTKTSTIDETLK